MIRAGADCFRINFSHANGPEVMPLVRMVRQVSAELGTHVPILADIQGPKLRIGKMPSEGALLREGQPFTLTGRPIPIGTGQLAHSQYEDLYRDVKPGTQIMLADGNLELVVEKLQGQDVHCQVITGGRLYSNKGMNLPRTRLSVGSGRREEH